MPTQIWINTRDGDTLLRAEDGTEVSGPVRITPAAGVSNLKIIVVAACGCKNPLIIESLPKGGATALEILHG